MTQAIRNWTAATALCSVAAVSGLGCIRGFVNDITPTPSRPIAVAQQNAASVATTLEGAVGLGLLGLGLTGLIALPVVARQPRP